MSSANLFPVSPTAAALSPGAEDFIDPIAGAAPDPEIRESVVHVIWKTKTWRLLAIILAQASASLFMLPVLPTLVTDDFAAQRAGHPIHCEDFDVHDAPPACQDAHSDVVLWSTWSGFAQNAIFSFILTPALGAWSDIHGRKPFLLIAQGLNLIPLSLILMNMHFGLPLKWLYVVSSFTGSVSLVAPSLSYIADAVPPVLRAPCFGLFLASFSLAILIGPPIGASLQPKTTPLAAMIMTIVCMLMNFLFLPESLTPRAAAEARHRQAEDDAKAMNFNNTSGLGGVGNNSNNTTATFTTRTPGPRAVIASTWRAMAILRRNALFIRLTAVLMVGAVVTEGVQDVLIQYLQIKLNFKAVDVSILFMAYGASSLLVQGVLLRLLLQKLGEKKLLIAGLLAQLAQNITIMLATQKWQAISGIVIASFGSVTFPTISSIKANAALDHEQGAVQGALNGAKSLASGVGPLAFAWLFAAFTRSDSELPFFPGAPFALGIALLVSTVVLAAGLPMSARDSFHGAGAAGGSFRSRGRGEFPSGDLGADLVDGRESEREREGHREGGGSGVDGESEKTRLLDPSERA
jgi:MFS transporter, DHA1 family, tetracycline resistance protein